MKYFTLFLLVSIFICCNQDRGYKHLDGLYYAKTDIDNLKHIVYSLHRDYAKKKFNEPFYSIPQSRAYFIKLEGKKLIRSAIKDMKANLPYDAFMKKYKDATTTKDLLTTQHCHSICQSRLGMIVGYLV